LSCVLVASDVIFFVSHWWFVGVDSSDDDCDLELQVPRQRLWPGLSSDEEEEHDFELVVVLLLFICHVERLM